MRSVTKMLFCEPEIRECHACSELRATLRACLGALGACYGTEPSVSEVVQGGILLRAEIALRTACSCGRDA